MELYIFLTMCTLKYCSSLLDQVDDDDDGDDDGDDDDDDGKWSDGGAPLLSVAISLH